MTGTTVGRVASLLLGTLVAAALAAADPDPWVGAERARVVEVLGEPDAVRERRGRVVLVYRLLELHPETPPPAGVMIVGVPGVGPLGRSVAAPGGKGETVRFEPAAVDEDGRLDGGGVERGRTASGSFDTETGEFERDWDGGDGVRGPATLRFTLDGDGRVVEWTVRPRRLRLEVAK